MATVNDNITPDPMGTAIPTAEDIAVPAGSSRTRNAIRQVGEKAGEKAAGLKGQAADKARAYANVGKDKAVGGLDSIQTMIGEAATTIDEKIGPEYGDYARRAADYVSGFAGSIRDKDVDALLEDAKTVIRKNPALAIGAAAAIGFVIARAVKAGVDATSSDTTNS